MAKKRIFLINKRQETIVAKGSVGRQTYVWSQLCWLSSVTLDKLVTSLSLTFFICKMEIKNNISFLGLWQGLNEMRCTKAHPFCLPKNLALVDVSLSPASSVFFCLFFFFNFLLAVLFLTAPVASVDLVKITSDLHITKSIGKVCSHLTWLSMWHS